jgi:hypothetical protein
MLRPSDVLVPTLFTSWLRNRTATLPGGAELTFREAVVPWPAPVQHQSALALVPGLLRRSEVAAILALVNDTALPLDTDPDSVDGMPSHEFFMNSKGKEDTEGTEDSDPVIRSRRQPVRDALQALVQPIIEERILPFVVHRYPEFCATGLPKRVCRPCTSLIRRYHPGDRMRHNVHRDGEALVTMVISLSDYEREYRGGLYVSNGKQRQVLPLSRGDAVFHQSDLMHGVSVEEREEGGKRFPSERWSWILWLRDHEDCTSHAYEWSKACAEEGSDALCQYMQAWRIHLNPRFHMPLNPSLGVVALEEARTMWMTRAAEGGFAEAMFKVGWALFAKKDEEGAVGWLRRAREAGDADACYALAWRLAVNATSPSSEAAYGAVKLLEEAARFGASPYGGATKAMFNLGVAHLYGYGVDARDPSLAVEWLRHSGLPEGLFYVAVSLNARGDTEGSAVWDARARRLGFDSDSRKMSKNAGFPLHIWPTTGSEGGPLAL